MPKVLCGGGCGRKRATNALSRAIPVCQECRRRGLGHRAGPAKVLEGEARERARAQTREWQDKRRAVVAEEAERRGGSCEAPGCDECEGLEWHHRRPEDKSFNIAQAVTVKSFEAIEAELAKCDLLCRPHHRAAEAAREIDFTPDIVAWLKEYH